MAARLHIHLHETRFCSFAIRTPGRAFHRNRRSVLPLRFVDDAFFGGCHYSRLGLDVRPWTAHWKPVAQAVAVHAPRDADQEQFFCRQIDKFGKRT
jgi:hypothetical protein